MWIAKRKTVSISASVQKIGELDFFLSLQFAWGGLPSFGGLRENRDDLPGSGLRHAAVLIRLFSMASTGT